VTSVSLCQLIDDSTAVIFWQLAQQYCIFWCWF